MHILTDFLDSKPLYYDEIDYERFPNIYRKIKDKISLPKIIHIIGTNGKGTTGRFLASALYNNGYRVGHYTSPHILKFNERIWINANEVSDEVLEGAHEKLYALLEKQDSDALSYFEYTTLLAMIVYEDCDYIVLEAGLGGEHDATAVFKKELTLVTPIDIDHEAFLGSDINSIARTKLNAIQNSAILARQKYDEVYAEAIKTGKNIIRIGSYLDQNDNEKISSISATLSLVSYLKENLSLAVGALKFLGIPYKETDFKEARLFGRLSKIADNIIVDVGHNPLAAESIVKELNGSKYIIVYNSYKDKDYKRILSILKPIAQRIEIIDIDGQRVEDRFKLHEILKDLKIEYTQYCEIKQNKNYLVFGSFSVVEQFLKEYSN